MRIMGVSLAFRELIDPGQRRRRAPACGAAVEAWTATTKIAFTESEGDPIMRLSLTFRELD